MNIANRLISWHNIKPTVLHIQTLLICKAATAECCCIYWLYYGNCKKKTSHSYEHLYEMLTNITNNAAINHRDNKVGDCRDEGSTWLTTHNSQTVQLFTVQLS